jgi:hypothetical protein
MHVRCAIAPGTISVQAVISVQAISSMTMVLISSQARLVTPRSPAPIRAGDGEGVISRPSLRFSKYIWGAHPVSGGADF